MSLFVRPVTARSMLLAALLGAVLPALFAQEPPSGAQGSTMSPGPVMSSGPNISGPNIMMAFDFANPALSPAAYHIEFDANGLGRYHSEPGAASPTEPRGAMPVSFDRPIQISAPLREQLFGLAHSHRFLSGQCDSGQRKVAFTGKKTITYTAPSGRAGCSFNWSQDAQLMRAAESFIAIAMTLEQGRQLHLSYLHDRLSLDAELETLAAAVKNGTAMELENIAPELQAIASDEAVMKRAQARAAALLAGAPGVIENAGLQTR